MDYLTFFKSIKNEVLKSYVFVGKEEFVKERALEELTEFALAGSDRNFNLQVLSGEAEMEAVYDMVITLPFMGKRRLVIWNDPKIFAKELTKEHTELLEKMLAELHDAVCLAIVLKSNFDKKKKYFDIFKKQSTVVEFNPLTSLDAVKWLRSYFKKRGKEIEPVVAEEIVSIVGTSVMELNNEAEKIYAAMGERIMVTRDDFKVLTGDNIEFTVFEMLNCFFCGKDKKGMEELYRLLKSGENSFMLLGAMASKLRGCYQAKLMLEKGIKPKEAAAMLGGGYSATKAVQDCKVMSMEQLKKGIAALEYGDYAVKNGLMTEEAAVEYAVGETFLNRVK